MSLYLVFALIMLTIITAIGSNVNKDMSKTEKNLRSFVLFLFFLGSMATFYVGSNSLENNINKQQENEARLVEQRRTIDAINNIEKDMFGDEGLKKDDLPAYIQKLESIDTDGVLINNIHFKDLKAEVYKNQRLNEDLEPFVEIIKTGRKHNQDIVMNYIDNGGEEPVNNPLYKTIKNKKFRPLVANKLRSDEELANQMFLFQSQQLLTRDSKAKDLDAKISEIHYINESRDRIIIISVGVILTSVSFFHFIRMLTKKNKHSI